MRALFGLARRIISTLTMALFAQLACAGPPFRTDDPDVGEYRELEVNLFFAQTLVADGREGDKPGLELSYGLLENVQVHVLAPLSFTTPSGQAIVRGYGDTELGVKFRIAEATDDTPSAAIAPLWEIPTGKVEKGLGNGGSQVFLPLWLGKRWGNFGTYGGGGYWINNGPQWKNYWQFGWQAQYAFSDHWTLGGELFYYTAEEVGQGSSVGFNLGFAYNWDKHNHVLFSAGKGLRNAVVTNRVSTYVAYLFTY